MRTLALLLLLVAGTAAAADEKTQGAPTSALPAVGSGSSTPMKIVKPAPLPTPAAAHVTGKPDDETRRRLMVLLMMRNAAQSFPEMLLRSAE
jgi:hypothetical protein